MPPPASPAAAQPLLIRISGRDRPGVTTELLSLVAEAGAQIEDIEQLVVRERLTLDLLVRLSDGTDGLVKDVLFWAYAHGVVAHFEYVEQTSRRASLQRHAVTVMGAHVPSAALAAVSGAIAASSGTIDRVVRLAVSPVTAYDFQVITDRADDLRVRLLEVAREHGVDIAVQPGGLERRAKRLVVMDVDSTLITDEVIELLASEAGRADQVTEITERAMAGKLDFAGSLRERVRLLAGLDAGAIERVRRRIRLTPGAGTFVRTLQRLGYAIAIVSGGFTVFTDRLRDDLGLDHAYANTLEIVDGRLTGELIGPLVDRARKAELLTAIAAAEHVPVSQTVAVGDGANDLDMLTTAGLGIAFNAKPVVRRQADTTISVPQLDAILFMLGIRDEDIADDTAH